MKERIVGAVVLVLFVVLVVPVFLDGPAEDAEMVSERVPLPGQSSQETRTIILDRDRDTPVPAASQSEPAESTPAPTPAIVEKTPEKPAPEPQRTVEKSPPPVEKTPPPAATIKLAPAASATGMWAVQLGSFGDKNNAERLAAELRKQGFAAFLSQLPTDSGALHRVRIGPQKDRESAEAMAVRLARAGHKGQVVPHP